MTVLLAVPSFASRIIEDSKSKFVLEDWVLEPSPVDCESPARYYRVALPTKDAPSFFVEDIKTEGVNKTACSVDTLDIQPLWASDPIFKDGLWLTDIRVPLYVGQGASAVLRRSFRLHVTFNGAANGTNPGKRALLRVLNPAGASRFGVSQTALRNGLRKAAVSEISDVNFLAQILVGDDSVATFSEDGVYAIDYKTIRTALLPLQRQDDLGGIEVDKIVLYGASQDTLADVGPGEAQRNPSQMFEIPIEIRDHSPGSSTPDGIFGEGDSLVFVGYGNGFWKRCDREDSAFVNGKMDYFHSYSPYSFYQSFLLGEKSTGKGLRLNEKIRAPSALAKDVEWIRYVRAEKDAILRDAYYGKTLDWESSSGKEWFWLWHSRKDTTKIAPSVLSFSGTETLPGFIKGGRQYVSVTYFPHRSVWAESVEGKIDQVPSVRLSEKSYAERMGEIRFSMDVNGRETRWDSTALIPGGNFRMDNPGLKASGNEYSLTMLPNIRQYDRFDGYTVAYQWKPTVEYAEWLLPGAVSGIIRIPVESGVQVLKFKNLRPVGLLSVADGFAKDSVSSSDDVRYLAFREGKFRSAVKVSGIAKPRENVLSDLTKPNSKLEYLIVTPEEFLDQAIALAEFRSDGSAISTVPTSVVTVENIYRHYTAGRQSPVAIRNFLSYVYSVCPNFKYVLFAGAGHYDYRGSNSKLTANLVPPFEKENAVIEDFFAALDSGESVGYGSYDIDVAVGRLPFLTAEEFGNYIQKAKEYEKPGVMDYSDWRSTLLLAADDALNSGRVDNSRHSIYQENIANLIDSLSAKKQQRWSIKKVYLLEYPEDAAGQKKEASDNLINIMNQGTLFTTYFGHGSKTDWASEGLLKPRYISRLNNEGRYTILGSFSCTVARFDEGTTRSLSEEFLFASKAGSIASIGATRETFANSNHQLAKSFLVQALTNEGITLGDAFFKAKGAVSSVYSSDRYNNEKYVLIGEPVIKMPDASLRVKLDQKLDTLKALDKMKLSGSVSGLQDGFINLVLSEGRTQKRMSLQVDEDSLDVTYDGTLIYSEEVPVKNGRFEVDFVTPRKISIGDTAAEFRAWAHSTKSPAVGRLWKSDLVVSGVSAYADSLKDTIPPKIQIQTCFNGGLATEFAYAQEVKLQSPACLQVVVSDSTALDFREQADEGVTFEVDGVLNPYHPWPYLEQTSKRAVVRMNFTSEQYPAGRYIFRVRAQDVLGNASTRSLIVQITDDMKAGLEDVYNAPNPMGKKGTTFYFKNLAVNRESKVNIYIYNQNGKLVKVLKDAVSGVTHWDGRDMHGRKLANGLYHYVVKSDVPASNGSGKKTWTKKQKLLISR
ncbi:MAG: hypothetical protein HUK19_05695 [Fibrobacter sp.]|mgnify:FL=1|nr:hypothetical protein [Fibrobacter sp.]